MYVFTTKVVLNVNLKHLKLFLVLFLIRLLMHDNLHIFQQLILKLSPIAVLFRVT